MKKILGLALVAMLSLTLAAPVSAGGGFHGGFRGGFHGGFHHDGFHRFGCCFGPAFFGRFPPRPLSALWAAFPMYATFIVFRSTTATCFAVRSATSSHRPSGVGAVP